jgi:hypothetical protein
MSITLDRPECRRSYLAILDARPDVINGHPILAFAKPDLGDIGRYATVPVVTWGWPAPEPFGANLAVWADDLDRWWLTEGAVFRTFPLAFRMMRVYVEHALYP